MNTRTTPRPRRAIGTIADPVLTSLLALTLGISLGLTGISIFPMSLTLDNVLYAIQAFAAVAGTHLTLVLLLLIARIPILDRSLGHDGLVRVHRKLGPWAVWLIALHVFLVVPLPTLGAQWPAELWLMLSSSIWYALAGVSILIFFVIGFTSWRRVRSKMKYGTWWSIHLLSYIGIALAFGHQIIGAGPFISGFARIWWIALYAVVLFNILAWRVFLPWIQNSQFSLTVDAVVRETEDTSSIWLKGRNLDLLQAQSGQFINLRFKHPGLLWEAHPFSLSAPVQTNHLRITVKNSGDSSAKMQELQPGTRAFIEGPYGISTTAAQRHQQALLISGGIGIAPMRALAESLSDNRKIKVDLVVRARSWEQLALRNELEILNQRDNVKVYYLLGSRQEYPIDENLFSHFLPDPTQTDIYACGSENLLADVRETAANFGVPETNLHIDSFEM